MDETAVSETVTIVGGKRRGLSSRQPHACSSSKLRPNRNCLGVLITAVVDMVIEGQTPSALAMMGRDLLPFVES